MEKIQVRTVIIWLGLWAALTPLSALAGDVEVVKADVRMQAAGLYTFSVTLRHADSGWDHYADRWDVLTPDGQLLGSRVLAHPHVHEQPFTRTLGGVSIPDTITSVVIRAHDLVHGDSAKTLRVALP